MKSFPWTRPPGRAQMPPEDRGYVHSATPDIDSIVVGHSYSILAWNAEPETSWVLPVSIERVASSSDAITVGVDQVKDLLKQRDARQCFDVVVADGRYGNHRFLGALREQPCGVLVRLPRALRRTGTIERSRSSLKARQALCFQGARDLGGVRSAYSTRRCAFRASRALPLAWPACQERCRDGLLGAALPGTS